MNTVIASPRFEIVLPPPPRHEIVRDNATGLMWPVEISPKHLTFAEAEKYIADLNAKKYHGFDDWRLPTRVELLTLVDDTRCDPAIDADAFPGTPSEYFWTSTDYTDDKKNYAWIVNFYDGGSGIVSRNGSDRVRAVRGPARQFSASLDRKE